MSGSGMISARPEGLAVDVEAEPLGCVSGWHLFGDQFGCVAMGTASGDSGRQSDWRPLSSHDGPLLWGHAGLAGSWVMVAGAPLRVDAWEIDPATMTFRFTPLADGSPADGEDVFAFDLGTPVAELEPTDAEAPAIPDAPGIRVLPILEADDAQPAAPIGDEPRVWLQSQAPQGFGVDRVAPGVPGSLILDEQSRIAGFRIPPEPGKPDWTFMLGSPAYRVVEPLPESLPPMTYVVRGNADEPEMIWGDRVGGDEDVAAAVATYVRGQALGIIMLAAAKCTEVQALADRGAIDAEGAGLFIRRYSESICDIASALAPEAMRESMQTRGN